MTTADFIKKTFDTKHHAIRKCSSVFTDTDGSVYSYGYHFPLLFKVDGLVFINTTNYSSTTRRHQSWARQAQPDAIPVRLEGRIPGTLYPIEVALAKEIVGLKTRMDKRTRKDTKVYADLQAQLDKTVENINKVRSAY